MTTLLTRMFARPRACSDCQVGQGRNCSCAKRPPRKVVARISETAWLWLLLIADVAVLVLAGHGAAALWRAWA